MLLYLLDMTNKEIARLLRQIAAAYTIKNEKDFHFQIVAYQRAADAIENSSTEISDLYKENALNTIPGVGPTLQSRLEELFKTGKVKHFDEVLKGIPKAVFPLLDVPSFGPKKAYRLVTEFNLKSAQSVIDDIEKLAKEDKISPLAGFGEKSQADVVQAITEFRKGAGKTTRMLLPFAQEVADNMIDYLKKSPDVVEAYPLGSLRRKMPTIGDVDIAVATHSPQKAIDYFVKFPRLERIIEQGPTSSSILASGGRQIDLIAQPVESFGSLLQHFTGSKHHNVHLRDFALKKGMSLSEKGIKNVKSGKLADYRKEEDFYNALGLDWIPPEIREDTGEIEAALNHHLPKLLELTDIKGDLHIHSSYPIEPSHDLGANTMQEMLNMAKELGYQYLGFSEHNPSVGKHTPSQIYEIMRKRKDYIEQLKESNKTVRIINLLELDILASGQLAIDDKSLELVDAVLISIHSAFSMDKDEMTQRVLKGLAHPKAKILSHPTGRLLNQRNGYDLDWSKIFAFCKENTKALEINAWPDRTDLPDTIIRQSVANGVKMVIDTDSHTASQMTAMRYGVWNARRGWAQKKDILNAMEYNDFIKWLKS